MAANRVFSCIKKSWQSIAMGWDSISSIVARLLAAYPIQSLILSILIIIGLSSGLVHLRLEQDIRKSFSPENSVAGYETRVWLEYYNLSIYPERAFCMFNGIDENTNVLSEKGLEEIYRVDKVLSAAVNYRKEINDSRECEPLCDLNGPFHLLVKEIRNPSSNNTGIIKFPDYPYEGMNVFLGLHLSNLDVIPPNNTLSSKTVLLWYFSKSKTKEGKQQFRDAIEYLFKISKESTSEFKTVKFTIFSDIIANREMIRGAIEATTLMTIGFFLLLTQVIIVIVRLSSFKMAAYLVATSLITPIASTVASFGLMCWFGYPTFSIQCVTPFLALGIGVDDAFILLHRWKHHITIGDKKRRLEQVIIDVGPSITITSLTNIIAFGIGFLTPTPQMSLFCLTASIALFLDYIFTYTILAPVVFLCDDPKYQPVDKSTLSKADNFLLKYSKFICSLKGRLLCGIVLIVMYAFTTYGVITMKTSFEPAKAFPSNSKLVDALENIKPVFDTYFPITIIVNKPPNITNHAEYQHFYSLLNELEHVQGIRGNNRSLNFLPQYEKSDRKIHALTSWIHGQKYEPSYDNLKFWLEQIGNPPLAKFESGNDKNVTAFRMTLLGEGMSEWAERARVMHQVRTILTNDQTFNATLFDCDSAILSIITTVGQDLIGSIAVTVICMALVCMVFVANINAVVIITSIIASICFVLVGGLSWWGADLDPVVQVDVLLATGFSVDYTAHVAYNFFRATGTPQERVLTSLAEMAEPMFEAGLSTFLCMLPLIFVPTYAIVCFAKTVFLVVAIGLLHGLFILPVILGVFSSDSSIEMKSLPTTDQPLVFVPTKEEVQ
ncbi:unnamed protein product [Caenorhabditis angaria]|uniref:SSD domain-containing protein n=1 Tax=Caenorhabditis angaria TaxID=860376 RepID=A0A9P1I3H8_9PELO|nr:unnamed protein product [Caenorhabditis angaria]